MDTSESMGHNEESGLSKGRLVLTDFMEEKSSIISPEKGRGGWRTVRRCSEYEDLSVDVSAGKMTFSSDGIKYPCLQKGSPPERFQELCSRSSGTEQWTPPMVNVEDPPDEDVEMLDPHPRPSTSETASVKEVHAIRKQNDGWVKGSVSNGEEEMYVHEDYHISPNDRVSLIRKKAFKSKLCKAMSIDAPPPNTDVPSRRRNLHLHTQSFDQGNDEYLPTLY